MSIIPNEQMRKRQILQDYTRQKTYDENVYTVKARISLTREQLKRKIYLTLLGFNFAPANKVWKVYYKVSPTGKRETVNKNYIYYVTDSEFFNPPKYIYTNLEISKDGKNDGYFKIEDLENNLIG